ncbi:MAG: hypothetical protein IJO60_05510, partial [Agathobacter sp.]|nr:hypothetical protein [Agathobacter sp.]
NLLYVHCTLVVVYLLTLIPAIGNWFNWISTIGSMATVFCLYKLMPVSERYRKATIFTGISVFFLLIGSIFNTSLLVSPVVMLCYYIGLYQEFYGHAEVLLTIDSALAKKWHALFNWRVFGGIIVAIVSGPIIGILAGVLLYTEDVIVTLAILMANGFELVLKVMYLVYLKRTYDVCEVYAHWGVENSVEN